MQKKYSSNISKRFPKNDLGQNFEKLLWIMYPVYQLYTLLHRQTIIILSLSNVIAYNISGFHAL